MAGHLNCRTGKRAGFLNANGSYDLEHGIQDSFRSREVKALCFRTRSLVSTLTPTNQRYGYRLVAGGIRRTSGLTDSAARRHSQEALVSACPTDNGVTDPALARLKRPGWWSDAAAALFPKVLVDGLPLSNGAPAGAHASALVTTRIALKWGVNATPPFQMPSLRQSGTANAKETPVATKASASIGLTSRLRWPHEGVTL